jgi:hypothetical protein
MRMGDLWRGRKMVFGLDRKAKLKRLLKELQVGIVGQTISSAADIAEKFDKSAAGDASYRLFFSVGPPKVATTQINQIILSLGVLGFFIHALDRLSFRQNSETLRESIFDCTALELSEWFGQMLAKLDPELASTAKHDTLSHLNLRQLQYSKAPTLLGRSADDKNSAVWLAACTIAEDLNHPKDFVLVMFIKIRLTEGLVELNLENRVKALEELL